MKDTRCAGIEVSDEMRMVQSIESINRDVSIMLGDCCS